MNPFLQSFDWILELFRQRGVFSVFVLRFNSSAHLKS